MTIHIVIPILSQRIRYTPLCNVYARTKYPATPSLIPHKVEKFRHSFQTFMIPFHTLSH